MMISHPDIEDIDQKLSSKRKNNTDFLSKSDKKFRKTEKDETSEKQSQNEVANSEKQTNLDHQIHKKAKVLQLLLVRDENVILKQQFQAKKDLPEEKTVEKDEKQLMKLLAEEEKRINQEQKLQARIQKAEEKKVQDELMVALREERAEEKRLADARRKEERKIAEEDRKKRLEEEKLERAEKKKQLEEEGLIKRKEKALKGMKYLLSVSEKYSDFYQEKLSGTTESLKQLVIHCSFLIQFCFKCFLNCRSSGKPLQERNKFVPTVDDMKQAAKLQKRMSNIKR